MKTNNQLLQSSANSLGATLESNRMYTNNELLAMIAGSLVSGGASSPVTSVNGETGAVVLTAPDVNALPSLVAVGKTVVGFNEGGSYTNVGYNEVPSAFALVMRDFNGDFTVKDASADQNPVSKKQLDTAIGGISSNSGNFGAPLTHTSSGGGDVSINASDVMVHLVTAGVETFVRLPSNPPAGKVFTIKRMDDDSHNFHITGAVGDNATIDGTLDIGMSGQNSFRTVIFDGSNWQIIGSNGA